MPGQSQIGGVNLPALLALVITLAVVFAPLVFARRPGQSDEDSDDGSGRGPRRPGDPPSSPSGGAPLDDAEPARVRLRDHERLSDLIPGTIRRGAREPGRAPSRTRT